MSTYTRNDRELNKIRSLEITPNFQPNNQSSCLVKLGNTHVCCSAILEDRVPGFLRNSGKGWLTAEYGMLPSSTSERMDREAAKGRQSGRTQEIQRLIGRSLRCAVNLDILVMKTSLLFFVTIFLIFMQGEVKADDHDAMNLGQVAHAFGWNFEEAEIQTEKVAEGLYVLFGVGGNIAASIGDDGVLIVDDQFPQVMDKVQAAISKVGGGAVDYAVNTHWHFDHAEGNNALGPKGTKIVAHANARADMAKGGLINMGIAKYRQQPYPEKALPVLTYDHGMQIHFNGGEIDLKNFASAHTNGDTAVFFKKQNAVHLGDVFNNAGYPFIDVGSGGLLV